jgi:hypothetical protein
MYLRNKLILIGLIFIFSYCFNKHDAIVDNKLVNKDSKDSLEIIKLNTKTLDSIYHILRNHIYYLDDNYSKEELDAMSKIIVSNKFEKGIVLISIANLDGILSNMSIKKSILTLDSLINLGHKELTSVLAKYNFEQGELNKCITYLDKGIRLGNIDTKYEKANLLLYGKLKYTSINKTYNNYKDTILGIKILEELVFEQNYALAIEDYGIYLFYGRFGLKKDIKKSYRMLKEIIMDERIKDIPGESDAIDFFIDEHFTIDSIGTVKSK